MKEGALPAEGRRECATLPTEAMTEPARKLSYTFAEYLALEAASETRHEYLERRSLRHGRGDPRARTPWPPTSSACSARAPLGRPCIVYTSDVRIRVLATGLGDLPGRQHRLRPVERDPADENTVVNPVVIVEVLSDSTEAYDRGEKFAHYRRIPSLRDYLLVSQHEPAHRALPPQRRRHLDAQPRGAAGGGAALNRLRALGRRRLPEPNPVARPAGIKPASAGRCPDLRELRQVVHVAVDIERVVRELRGTATRPRR